ncbi:MAG: hypothetical protein Q7K43_03480 [Candidatus Woesearchaeota archaeon]|nr:hypothetical protein [Candidatus Woesearchaeota archaeon]
MNSEVLFAFGIRTLQTEKGTLFIPQARNDGLPEEVILTVMRQWLKAREKDYRSRLTG